MMLFEVFKNTNYSETLFIDKEIEAINKRIIVKQVRGKDIPYITSLVREKAIKLTPEEAVRQLYVHRLLNTYGYPKSRLQMEYPVHFGQGIKRADSLMLCGTFNKSCH